MLLLGTGERGDGSYGLMGRVLDLKNIKRVLEMNDGDGFTTA